MKPKLITGMTLMALALATGGFMVMQSQPEGDPSLESPGTDRSRERGRPGTASSGSPAAGAHSVAELPPQARHGELSAEYEARLRALENGGVALGEIPDTLRFLQSLPDQPEIRELMVALIRQWAESDAPTAARWAEGLPVGGVRQESLNGVAIVWANQDLDGAIQWTTSLPEGDERNEMLRGVAYEAARSEPLLALDIAVELPTSPENNALIQHAAMQWASESPEEAASWAGGMPDEALRDRVLSQIATVWGDTDPVAASTLALTGIPPGRAQDDAVIGIVQRWVPIDPAAAAEWVGSFPEGALHETAVECIAKLSPEESQ